MKDIYYLIYDKPEICKRFNSLVKILCAYLTEEGLAHNDKLAVRYKPTEHIKLILKDNGRHDKHGLFCYKWIHVYYQKKRLSLPEYLFTFLAMVTSGGNRVSKGNIRALELLPLMEEELSILSDKVEKYKQTKRLEQEVNSQKDKDIVEEAISKLGV